MGLVDNSSFVLSLEKLAKTARADSSLTITFKRYNGWDKPKPREGRPPPKDPEQYMCLIRVQMKSKKVSTLVKQDDVSKIMSMFVQFMKSNMDGLKRVKKVKSKGKQSVLL